MSEDNNNNSMIMIKSLKYNILVVQLKCNSTELLLNKIHFKLFTFDLFAVCDRRVNNVINPVFTFYTCSKTST